MRGLPVILGLLTPVAVLIAFQGMVTAGLLPLAVFGPFYVIARALAPLPGEARTEGARMVVIASLGGGLALATTLLFLDPPSGLDHVSGGLFIVSAGLGGLAGLATAPRSRGLTPEEERRWTIVQAINREHGRGLALLFLAALPAAVLLGLLREAPLFLGPDGGMHGLPEALFGGLAHQGYLLLPGPGWSMAVALPISLAPLALGFLTPQRSSLAVGLGGLALLVMLPVAVGFDLPVLTASGNAIPLSLHARPALAALPILAPAGAGALLGAGVAWLAQTGRPGSLADAVGWVLAGAAVAALLQGLVPAIGLVVGIAVAAILLGWRTGQAPLGAALAVGAILGVVLSLVTGRASAILIGALVGIVAGSAVISGEATRSLPLPQGAVRSLRTLSYAVVALIAGGLLAYLASRPITAELSPFEAPHARALSSGLVALVDGDYVGFLLWGLVAGVVVEVLTGRGAMAALGFLAGPGVALLVVLGSLGRSLWERYLFNRARKGWVMRGEMGYELLRAHVLAGAVLAGEAITLAVTGWLSF